MVVLIRFLIRTESQLLIPFSRWREKVPKAAEKCSCIFGISAIHGGQMRVAHP